MVQEPLALKRPHTFLIHLLLEIVLNSQLLSKILSLTILGLAYGSGI